MQKLKEFSLNGIKMKKKRFFLIISISVLLVLAFMIGSPFFKLKSVEIKFINDKNEVVLLKDNFVFNSQQKINKIISSAKFDYGSSLFLINKQNYVSRLDKSNPYLKLINISSVFPNKMVVYAKERKPVFYIRNTENYFLLDSDFKILDVISNLDEISNLICISASEKDREKTFFEFFNISNFALEPGQYLYENNIIIDNIKNIIKIINAFDCFNIHNKNVIKKIIIYENENFANICFKTNSEIYGIELKIENVLENFDKKLNKLLNAFKTLINQEKIKTTYGVLSINSSFNCYWNNL